MQRYSTMYVNISMFRKACVQDCMVHNLNYKCILPHTQILMLCNFCSGENKSLNIHAIVNVMLLMLYIMCLRRKAFILLKTTSGYGSNIRFPQEEHPL